MPRGQNWVFSLCTLCLLRVSRDLGLIVEVLVVARSLAYDVGGALLKLKRKFRIGLLVVSGGVIERLILI